MPLQRCDSCGMPSFDMRGVSAGLITETDKQPDVVDDLEQSVISSSLYKHFQLSTDLKWILQEVIELHQYSFHTD